MTRLCIEEAPTVVFCRPTLGSGDLWYWTYFAQSEHMIGSLIISTTVFIIIGITSCLCPITVKKVNAKAWHYKLYADLGAYDPGHTYADERFNHK